MEKIINGVKYVRDTQGQWLNETKFYNKWFNDGKRSALPVKPTLYKCVECGCDVYRQKSNFKNVKCLDCKFNKHNIKEKAETTCTYCGSLIQRLICQIGKVKFSCEECKTALRRDIALRAYKKRRKKLFDKMK